ncbi:alpha-N-acetylgalactosamine-specific lectin-like [Clupea harengus]|uniref:Alpha-N-acetylgalactosamine-specific lectin-like n=1 Tax=Clupea harengus TaxID=7950 RepID=A0A6P8F0Z6_CLUHA|nr:alpha-N-acetylgalactosamine-specific lectin-like [Clupea harengus]XP_042559503.1 alpha-N-acetylgalactosamine-specific lectin-like [Clupea harengus]
MATLIIWISACAVLLCGVHGQHKCPPGWSVFNRRCFKIVTSSSTFHKAQMACANENAHLASVHSAAENDFIQGLVRNAGLSSQGAWIGGSDDGSEGTWYWIDGSAFDFSDWTIGQPDNYHTEDCLMLTPDGNLRWNDLRCDDLRPFICSKKSPYWDKLHMTDVSCAP